MRRLLNYYFFFNLYQAIIGSKNWHRRYAESFIMPGIKKSGVSILDFGCGAGNILKALPLDISYTGIDYQKSYID